MNDGKKIIKVSYDRLWKLLIDRKMKKIDLRKGSGISTNILAAMGKEQPIPIKSIMMICEYLGVDVSEIMEFVFEA